jgi:hypothetical protein
VNIADKLIPVIVTLILIGDDPHGIIGSTCKNRYFILAHCQLFAYFMYAKRLRIIVLADH